VIALSVAAALAVFILYTSIAGATTAEVQPADLAKNVGKHVTLMGTVVATGGNAHAPAGMRFVVRNVTTHTSARATVVYHGTVPDLYKVGRQVVVTGTYRDGIFTADDGSLSTKCPSKYAPAKSSSKT
jgi:cytochrome c-type biogenesis protein CcmE